ncbi:hypothetical protein R6Q57_025451 [Mikania cordata]
MNRSQVMEIKELASLRPRVAASPIEVRVVRIWKPPFRDNETCFLLVDKRVEDKITKTQRSYVSLILQDTRYRLQATISDDTCSNNATLFDEVVKILVGIECADLVTKSTSTDMTSIPLLVLEISGKTTKFHAQASKDTRLGAIRCVVNKVTMAEINTENDLLTISPTTVPRTPQPQQAPSINQLATKRLNLFPEGTMTML